MILHTVPAVSYFFPLSYFSIPANSLIWNRLRWQLNVLSEAMKKHAKKKFGVPYLKKMWLPVSFITTNGSSLRKYAMCNA